MSIPSGNKLPPQRLQIVPSVKNRYRRTIKRKPFLILFAIILCADFILLGDPRYQWHRWQATYLESRHQYSQALAELKAALSINSSHAYDYSRLARIYDDLGQDQAAVQAISTEISMERFPMDYSASLSVRAYYHDKARQIPEAIADYTSSIAWAGKAQTDHYYFKLRTIKYSLRNRMMDYYRSKRYRDAISDARQLSEMDPDDESVVAALAKYEVAAGDLASAEIDAQKAIKLDPKDENAYYDLSSVYELRHQYGNALSVDDREIQALPNSPNAYGNHGWFEYKLGNYDVAISDSRKALSLHPQSPDYIYFNIGLVYAVQGNWASAKEAYQEAFRHSPAKDLRPPHDDVLEALKLSPHNTALQQADLLFRMQKA